MGNTIAKLRFAWWNTGLSPRIHGRKKQTPSIRSDAYKQLAVDVVANMFARGDVSLIGLGEVQLADVQMLQKAIVEPLQMYVDTSENTLLAILYKADIVTLIEVLALVDHYGRKRMCRGLETLFSTGDGSLDFSLYVCHWPSRMQGKQAIREREKLAISLSDRLGNEYETEYPVVVMGDFNDEPFDRSMTDHLRGSRDRRLVIKDSTLLYNPFWRRLGERQDISEEPTGRLAPGTHFYASDQLTQWLTVDQALVSREFLGSSNWILNETETGPLQLAPLISDKGRLRLKFDHFPIVVTFDKLSTT